MHLPNLYLFLLEHAVKSKSLILSTGLAMFAMFFGSGNLVFPILVGQLSQGHTVLSSIGILLTGVLVPFLGILAMLLFKGDTSLFFSRLGKPATFWFSLFALAIMGPFGVLARCITVAHGAFCLLAPSTPLWIFSLVTCVVLFVLTIRKNRIVPMLGSILTPLLLVSLVAITVFGLSSMPLPAASAGGSWASFKIGIFQGYQTMDLLAAFFFSTFVINHLKQNEQPGISSLSIFFNSSLIGAGLLSSIYVVLVLLGAMYAPQLAGVPPQALFAKVTEYVLGPYAAIVVCTAVILACLTTAIVLTSLFSDFLKKEVAREKISPAVAICTTLAIGFFISTLEFSGIMRFIGPILEVIYPALIVMTILNIAYKSWGWKTVRLPTAVVFALKLISVAI
jgi:LIVCS family branched-chain amino acid:cation transporter